MWNFWEHLHCVAHSPLIVRMTMAPLFSLETCIVQIQSVWVKFSCTKKTVQSLSRSNYQCPQCASVCQVRNIHFESKQILFFVVWSVGSHFWRESKVTSRCYWRCLLSWQLMFQQRKMRISWWLCNNSEIHLWLWKVWRLNVSFYVTGARIDDTNWQNTLFLC